MKFSHILLAVIVAALWGCNFVAAKLAMQEFPPFFLLAVRLFLVWIILLPFVPKFEVSWKYLGLLSFLLATLHFAAMYFALNLGLDVPSAVIAGQLGVPVSCALGAYVFKDKIGAGRAFGILVSFFGVIVIAGTPQIANNFIPFIIACLAGACWGVSNIAMKKASSAPILSLLCKISLLAVPQLLIFSLIMEKGQIASLYNAGVVEWSAMMYSVIFSTIAAYGLWYWLLSKYDVSQIAPYSLLIPVFGITSGQLFFDEPFTLQMQIGAALTIAGVAVITLRRPKRMIVPR